MMDPIKWLEQRIEKFRQRIIDEARRIPGRLGSSATQLANNHGASFAAQESGVFPSWELAELLDSKFGSRFVAILREFWGVK